MVVIKQFNTIVLRFSTLRTSPNHFSTSWNSKNRDMEWILKIKYFFLKIENKVPET